MRLHRVSRKRARGGVSRRKVVQEIMEEREGRWNGVTSVQGGEGRVVEGSGKWSGKCPWRGGEGEELEVFKERRGDGWSGVGKLHCLVISAPPYQRWGLLEHSRLLAVRGGEHVGEGGVPPHGA